MQIYLKVLNNEQKKTFLWLLPLLAIGSFTEMLGLRMIVSLCTVLMSGVSPDAIPIFLYHFLSRIGSGSAGTSSRVITLLLIFYPIKSLYLIWLQYVIQSYVAHFRHDLGTQILEKMVGLPYPWYIQHSSSEAENYLTHMMHQITTGVRAILQLLQELLVVFFICCYLFLLNPRMTGILVLILGGFLLGFQFCLRIHIRKVAARQQKASRSRLHWISQIIEGIAEIRICQAEPAFTDKFSSEDREFCNADRTRFFWERIPAIWIELVLVCSVLLYLCTTKVPLETVLTSLSALTIGAVRLIPSWGRISGNLTRIRSSLPSVEAISTFLQEGAEPATDQLQTGCFAKNLTVDRVSFRYPQSKRMVLENISMEIRAGSIVGICGPSGSGKSTLSLLLLGLLNPTFGTIRADGIDLAKCKKS